MIVAMTVLVVIARVLVKEPMIVLVLMIVLAFAILWEAWKAEHCAATLVLGRTQTNSCTRDCSVVYPFRRTDAQFHRYAALTTSWQLSAA